MNSKLLQQMKKAANLGLSVIGAILFLALHSYSQSQPKVIGIFVDGILVNSGYADGVKVGSKGKIFYEEKISGKRVNNYIALFVVTKVDINTCQGKVTKKQKDPQIGYLALFTTPIIPPPSGEKVAWESVKESQNSEDFHAFLKKFPKGVFSDLAKNRIKALERIDWDSVKDSQNPEDFHAFLKKFPNGAFSDMANDRINILALEKEAKKLAELERIGLFALDPQLATEYSRKLQRIMIPIAMESINAFGQITIFLDVDGNGKILINSLDMQLLTVDPLTQQGHVQSLISLAFTQVGLLPPRNRIGQAVILEKWRLSFKVVTLAEKITLIKQ